MTPLSLLSCADSAVAPPTPDLQAQPQPGLLGRKPSTPVSCYTTELPAFTLSFPSSASRPHYFDSLMADLCLRASSQFCLKLPREPAAMTPSPNKAVGRPRYPWGLLVFYLPPPCSQEPSDSCGPLLRIPVHALLGCTPHV